MPDFRAIAAQKARQYGVPVNVFLQQIQQESGFNPAARSGAGAQGIAQFMPATARQYGVNTADPISSLTGAAHMDADLIQRYGSVARALSAYNSGKPDAYKDPGFAGGQTYNYVRSILGKAGQQPNAPALGRPAGASPVAAALGQPAAQAQPVTPPPDPRQHLLQALSATKGGDLTGFYQQLGKARLAQQQAAAQPAPVAASAPMAPAQGGGKLQKLPPGTNTGGAIAKTALTQIGTPYQWGGPAKLGSRTDCSGLLQASAAANGVHIGRTTYEQWKQGTAVPLQQLQPGDAVFFHPGPKGPEHVAIYIGGGKVVEDPHTGASVEISQLAGRGAIGARRY